MMMRGCPPLTPAQVKATLRGLKGRYRWRDRAIVVLGIRTGLRIGELVALKIEDVWAGVRPPRAGVFGPKERQGPKSWNLDHPSSPGGRGHREMDQHAEDCFRERLALPKPKEFVTSVGNEVSVGDSPPGSDRGRSERNARNPCFAQVLRA
jgi:hypothetical protein